MHRQLAFVLIFLSGATGLIYQVTWQKYVSTLVGSHASATSAVLALFFLFLSAGYSFFGRFSTRIIKNQIKMYAFLEFAIGLYALYSPILFENIFDFFIHSTKISESSDGGLFMPLLLGGVFMFIPTFLMGGTIPALTQGLSLTQSLSSRTHALIYGLNTLGAFFGCILGGFFLIEWLGLDGTLLLTGNLNILIGIVAFVIAKSKTSDFAGPAHDTSVAEASSGHASVLWLYLISFCSGYYTFALEKLIVRMAGVSLGSTVYTYSIIVSAFILAIGLGSLLLTLNKKFERPNFFAFVQLASLLAVVALYLTIPNWPEWFFRLRALIQTHPANFEWYWTLILISFIFLLIFPVGLLGANLPLLFGLLRSQNTLLTRTVGRLYTVNCLGSVTGAALGGYWIFHFFTAGEAFLIAVYVVLLATALSFWYLFKNKVRWVAILSALVVAGLLMFLPKWQVGNFVPGLYLMKGQLDSTKNIKQAVEDFRRGQNRVLFSQYDPNTFATVIEQDDMDKSVSLYVNGKPDAHSSGDARTRAMAALIPMSLMPQKIKRAFIIGLGGGLSTAILSNMSELEKLDVAEISEGVINSLPYFDKYNYGLKDRMNKVNIRIGDAYRTLMEKQKYDLIVCEPSNPWVSGVEKLYAKEFYQIGFDRLTENGFYVQWFPFSAVDDATLLTIFKTFRSVFPHVTLYSAYGGAFTLVGSKAPLRYEPAQIEARFLESKKIFNDNGFTAATDVLFMQLLSPFMFDALVDRVTSEHSLFAPVLEFRASRAYFGNVVTDITGLLTQKIPLPLPEEIERNQFVYEQAGIRFNPESIFSVFKMASGVVHFHRLKLFFTFKKAFPNAKNFDDFKHEFKEYIYLTTDKTFDTSRFRVRATRLQDLQAILTKFRLAVALDLKPRLGRVAELIENDCLENSCYAEKRTAVIALAEPKTSNEVQQYAFAQPTPEQAKKVEMGWEQIKNLYLKLNSY